MRNSRCGGMRRRLAEWFDFGTPVVIVLSFSPFGIFDRVWSPLCSRYSVHTPLSVFLVWSTSLVVAFLYRLPFAFSFLMAFSTSHCNNSYNTTQCPMYIPSLCISAAFGLEALRRTATNGSASELFGEFPASPNLVVACKLPRRASFVTKEFMRL